MDHVIDSLKNWLLVYQEREESDRDKKAERCIKNALDELHRYYTAQPDDIERYNKDLYEKYIIFKMHNPKYRQMTFNEFAWRYERGDLKGEHLR